MKKLLTNTLNLKKLCDKKLQVLFLQNYNYKTAFGDNFLISIRKELESRVQYYV